jgi:N-methylhydantoinase B/oxoprolinase/acetone carboxylase alpha subunit
MRAGGAGRWRGRLATAMEFRVFAPNTRMNGTYRDRTASGLGASPAAARLG